MKVEMPEMVATGMHEFTGRGWVLPKLLEWLERTETRTFIFTGKPGTGKSSLVAWLSGTETTTEGDEGNLELKRVRSFVKAVHFCMANTLNAVPKALAQSLAEQLTRNVSGFAQALTASLADLVSISIEQHVGEAHAGANVTGAQIKQLNLGNFSEVSSFNRVIREPLKRLYEGEHGEMTLIVIDALDETPELEKETGVVSILSQLDDLPKQVRFLMTTRPDRRVLKQFPSAEVVDLISDNPVDTDDLRDYAYKRLTLSDSKQRTQLAESIRDEAKGNFLYARLVIDNLLPRLNDLTDLSTISFPKGLSGIYSEFMNRELGLDEDLWFETYEPLLGLIAVARGDGMSREQLEAIVGKGLLKELRKCQQYLSGSLPDGPFRPFHKSFADYLLEDPTNIDYKIDAANMHRRVRNFYRGDAASWDEVDWTAMDDYGLLHLASHLYALRREKGCRQDLYDYLCGPLMSEKLKRYGSPQPFVADTSLTIKAARAEEPRNLLEEVRGYFIYARLGWMSTLLEPEVLGALAALGQVEKAKGYAALIQDVKNQYKAYCLIGEELASQQRYEEARTVSASALSAADKILALAAADKIWIAKDHHHEARCEVIRVMAMAEDKAGLEGIAASVEETYDLTTYKASNLVRRAQVFGRLAVAFARMNEQDRAAELARNARASIELIEDRDPLLGQVDHIGFQDTVSNFAELGDKAGVELILSKTRHLGGSFSWNVVLHAVVRAFVLLGEREKGIAVAEELFESALGIKDHMSKVMMLEPVARSFIQLDEKEKARGAVEHALAAANEITDPYWRVAHHYMLEEVLRELGQEQVVRQAAEEALRIARQSASPDSQTMQSIIIALTKLKAKEELQKLSDSVAHCKDYVISDLASSLAGMGELESALKLAKAIRNLQGKSSALANIVKALLSEENYERAFEIAEEIEDDTIKMDVMRWMSSHLKGRGQEKLAADAAEGALAIVRKASKGGVVRGQALGQFALSLLKVGQTTRAAEIAKRVFEELVTIHPNSFSPTNLVAPIQVLIQVGELDKALKLIDKSYRFYSWQQRDQVVEALIGVGEVELARITAMAMRDWITYVMEESKTGPNWYWLANISLVFATIGELPHAKELAQQALPMASEIVGNDSSKSSALCLASRALLRVGEKELALDVARQSLESAMKARDWRSSSGIDFVADERADAIEALVSAGDMQTAAMAAISLAKDVEYYVDLALISAAGRACAAVGIVGVKGIEWVQEQAARLKEDSRATAMIALAQHFSKAGGMKQALNCMLSALESVPTTTAHLMWDALGSGADALAVVDRGETLWCIYEEIMKVDDWF